MLLLAELAGAYSSGAAIDAYIHWGAAATDAYVHWGLRLQMPIYNGGPGCRRR
jgi:hypothetical protein